MAPARPFWDDDDSLRARLRKKQRAAVGALGKLITRRSRGLCELCEDRDGCRPFELAPFPTVPSPERTLMACMRCRTWLDTGNVVAVESWFLTAAVWHEEPAVRLAAARLLLHSEPAPWIVDALEAVGVNRRTGELQDEAGP